MLHCIWGDKMKILKPKDVANMLNVTVKTLQNWDYSGKLIAKRNPNNRRYYTFEQINELLGKEKIESKKVVIGYCRVSSNKQKDDLNRQIENVKTYMFSKGYQFEIIKDIGSGINYNKKGLNKLIQMVISNRVEKIVIAYKDRLLRFGFELVENVCKLYDVEIEIIDNTEKTEEQELVEDLVQIITVFSCRLNGKRANKLKKIAREVDRYD